MRPEHRLDRRSPLVFDIHELGRRAGTMRELSRTVPAPAELGLEVISVPEGSDVELDLRVEAVVEGVLVTGTATAQLQGVCSRCLSELNEDASFNLQELFFYPGRELEQDESLIQDESFDLEETLRAAVVLELPFTPLCVADCPGLCPECGFRLADDPGHQHEAAIDPRWGKLAALDVNQTSEH